MRKLQIAAFVAITIATGFGCSKQVPNTAEGVVNKASAAMKDYKIGEVYAMLPESYKKDLQDLTTGYIAIIDAETWDNSAKSLGNVFTGAAKNPDEVHKSLGQFAEMVKKDELKEALEELDDQWTILEKSGLTKYSTAKSLNIQKFLNESGPAILKSMKEYSEMLPQTEENPVMEADDLADVKVTVKEKNANRTLLTITNKDGESEDVAFVKVEGRWIPEELALGWKDRIKAAKTDLELAKAKYAENKDKYLQTSRSLLKATDEFAKDGNVQHLMSAVGALR